MNQIVIMDTVREAENLLNDARSFYMRSELHDSERCTLEALALLKPYEDMDDIGESTDEASVKHAVIESIAHVYNRLNTIYDARGDYHKAIEYGKTAIENREVRQVAMVDTKGRVAVHTGNRCIAEAGYQTGNQFSVQANMMLKNTVWPAMAVAYESAQGDLADRLLAALDAAQAEGGDIRGKQSAANLIVTGKQIGRAHV